MEYMTVRQIAGRLGISRQAVQYHIEKGNLKAESMGFFQLIAREDAERFIAEHKPRRTRKPSPPTPDAD